MPFLILSYSPKLKAADRFNGVKVSLILTLDGFPVELEFLPGSAHDSGFLQALSLDFTSGDKVYVDSGFLNYDS